MGRNEPPAPRREKLLAAAQVAVLVALIVVAAHTLRAMILQACR